MAGASFELDSNGEPHKQAFHGRSGGAQLRQLFQSGREHALADHVEFCDHVRAN